MDYAAATPAVKDVISAVASEPQAFADWVRDKIGGTCRQKLKVLEWRNQVITREKNLAWGRCPAPAGLCLQPPPAPDTLETLTLNSPHSTSLRFG